MSLGDIGLLKFRKAKVRGKCTEFFQKLKLIKHHRKWFQNDILGNVQVGDDEDMCLGCSELDFYTFMELWNSHCYFAGRTRGTFELTQIDLILLFNILEYCARLMMLKFFRSFVQLLRIPLHSYREFKVSFTVCVASL